jgi:hypothetical protein
VTINILPGDVLLEIFDFYVDPTRKYDGLEAWCTLVHVCRKWRNIVLESPLRLNLRIRCYPATPTRSRQEKSRLRKVRGRVKTALLVATSMREKLDIWPALPIALEQYDKYWGSTWGVVNVAAVLEQNNRICQIGLFDVPTSQMEVILAAMHKPFPVLTDLRLESDDQTGSVDPGSFLGGSAPCLRYLQLDYIPFPGLPKLLFSATHLTDLRLFHISHSGYISPEAMVSCFSALTRLESFFLHFRSPESFPVREHRRPPPPTHTLLPALTQLSFYGISEYLDDLVVRIDTPLLDHLKTNFFYFIPDTVQLVQFIDRTPKLKAHNEAHMFFYKLGVHLKFPQQFVKGLEILYKVVDWQVLSVAQVFTSSPSHAFSATVERLYICDNYASWEGDIRVEENHWLELLRPFTSVKSLYLSRVIVPRIAPALQELIGERVAEVLPALQTLFLEDSNLSGPVQEAIELFVSGRQFSSHPVAVSHWERQWSD